MKFKILPAADLEAVDAAVWYDDQRAGLGDEFLTELKRAYLRLRDFPHACSRSECYVGPHNVRRCLLQRFPYVVISLHRPEETVVIAVSHVRRHPNYWLTRIE